MRTFRLGANFLMFKTYYYKDLYPQVEIRKEDPPPSSEDDCLFQGYLCGPIASTMDHDMFAMVVSRWHAYSEAAKETNDWTSLSITGSLFKEMVNILCLFYNKLLGTFHLFLK